MPEKTIMINSIEIKQIEEVARILTKEAKESNVVVRSYKQILEMRDNYFVALDNDKIIGIVGYIVWPGKHPEIVSWVVKKKYRGKGIGEFLLAYVLARIANRGFSVVYAFTDKPNEFIKFGFKKTDIRNLPLKMENDCRFCPKNYGHPSNPLCKETPMKKFL